MRRWSASMNRSRRQMLQKAAGLSAIVLLTSYTLSADQKNIESMDSSMGQPAGDALGSEFWKATETGRRVIDYLNCIDFDCTDKLNALVALGQDTVPSLIQLIRKGAPEGVPELRDVSLVRVATALGKLRDDRAVDPLVDLSESPDPLVRAHAARALGDIGGRNALRHLLPLLQDEDQLVREMTAQALSSMSIKEALPSLRHAAASEPLSHVREAMEKAIKNLEIH